MARLTGCALVCSFFQVWHNYAFDRHVLNNMGIECHDLNGNGFGGDTLHMARLLDASRKGRKTYALDSLTDDKDVRECFFS
jgi:DNA polymerase-1